MMRHLKVGLAVLLAPFAWTAMGAAKSPEFTAKPTVKSERDGVRISFTVNGPTDVEVAVLNQKGKVVRHLAAGMLGDNAPAPLKKGSLSQELLWDKTDDLGKPAPDGPFKVRVRLGMKPVFSHFIADGAANQRNAIAMTCDKKGNLYVLSKASGPLQAGNPHWTSVQMKVFDRDGQYLRQVMPYPSNLPESKRKGLTWFALEDGSTVPFNHLGGIKSNLFWLYPPPSSPKISSFQIRNDNKIILCSSRSYGIGQLTAVDHMGGMDDDFVGPELGEARSRFGNRFALSPDGKTVYSTRCTTLYPNNKIKQKYAPVVYRAPWGPKAKPEIFLGEMEKPGDGPSQFKDPRGLATDAKGNLYVCDHGNHRVAVFSAEGKTLAQISVKNPNVIAVHPRSGVIYVMAEPRGGNAWGGRPSRLVKFDGMNATKPAAEWECGRSGKMLQGGKFCLDGQSEPPILWVAPFTSTFTKSKRPGSQILKLVDLGDKFEPRGAPISEQVPEFATSSSIIDAMVDRERDEVYPGGFYVPKRCQRTFSRPRFDGLSGQKTGAFELKNFGTSLTEMSMGRDGLIYMMPYKGGVSRFTRDCRPAPFSATGKHTLDTGPQGHQRGRGFDITPRGDIYSLHNIKWRCRGDHKVSHYGADGKLIKEGLVEIKGPSVGGIQVDRKGNVYVGVAARPTGRLLPKGFEGKKIADRYKWYYGTLMKFRPDGGGLKADPAGDWETGHNSASHKRLKGEGLAWGYHGMWVQNVTGTGCHCQSPRFAVDDYGRVFLPDTIRYSVVVLDTNGNPIKRFGGYGNQDSRGPGSAIPEPAIPFAWLCAIYTSDRLVYCVDTMNHRMVAVRLAAEKEVLCAINVDASSQTALGPAGRK